MEVFLCILYSLLFLTLIRILPFFKLQGIHKNALPGILLLKIAAGIVMYLVYTRFYTDRAAADIFKYFDDSKVMYDAFFEKPLDFLRMITGIDNDSPYFTRYYNEMNNWYRVYESNIYNDSHTIIRMNALMRFFSFGYYNVHTVFMSFLSLIGLTGIYRFFEKPLSDRKNGLFLAVFLIPSVVFWGSGVLKEGLLFFGLGMFLWHTELLLQRRRILISILFILFAFTLLLYTKFYIIIVMLPLVIAYIWCRFTKMKWVFLKFLSIVVASVAIGINIKYLLPDYDLVGILVQKQNDFINLAHSVHSGSLIEMEPLRNHFGSLLWHAPEAFYNALCRPWFFESSSPLILFAGVENLLILLLLVATAVFIKLPTREQFSLFWLSFFFFAGIFVLTGLTTPVMGAIVRYKVPALPFLAITLLLLMDVERISRILPLRGLLKQ